MLEQKDKEFIKELISPLYIEIGEMKVEMKEMRKDIAELKTDMKDVKQRLSVVENDVAELKTDVAELKTDVAELKTDVAELKTDVAKLKTDVAELKTDVIQLKTDVSELQTNYSNMHEQIIYLETRVHRTNILLENDIPNQIGFLSDGHAFLNEKMEKVLGISEEHKLLVTRVNILEGAFRKHTGMAPCEAI